MRVNEAALDILECEQDDLLGRRRHPRLLGSEARGEDREWACVDGSMIVVSSRYSEIHPAAGALEGSVEILDDRTQLTRLSERVHSLDKVAALGTMAAGIAHEIRNPLGAISHAAQLLRESSDLAPADIRMAEIIQHHCERVNQTVESVMQISRREPPKPQYLMLSPWLTEFVRGYLHALNRPAEVTINCDYKELLVEFDPENLQRVLGNLLDNALRHGKLATGRETARIEVDLDSTLHLCQIDVIDNGAGVPSADQAKLFEPFFTTMSEGSGMGLYLCKELCEINNADLDYRLTRKGESCFRISVNQRAV